MLPDIQPGNTKILYFFNCLLDGMHTIGGNGFVCSVSNELNSNYPNATSSVSISVNPKENNIVPILLCFPADISGISSSTTT